MEWELDRPDRTFRIHVVEPRGSGDNRHDELFLKAIVASLSPRTDTTVDSIPQWNAPAISWFDLLTFPEAFLASDAFVTALNDIHDYGIGSLGCVHVGLRPPRTEATHLFNKTRMTDLVGQLLAIGNIEHRDLDFFAQWVAQQADDKFFNLGCLFAIADGRIRVCLHTKSLRSKFELHSDPERSMAEGNIVTAVTVKPATKGIKTVTIQPVICADALDMTGDSGWRGPLDTINGDLDGEPPDEVDVVSLSTWSPQGLKQGNPTWQLDFKNSFLQSGKSRDRHNLAIFAMANMGLFKGKPAGLSGLFLPKRTRHEYPDYLVAFHFGTEVPGEENRWTFAREELDPKFSSLASILSIAHDRKRDSDIATMVGFTLPRLPRDMAPTATDMTATNCRIHVARLDETDQVVFEGGL